MAKHADRSDEWKAGYRTAAADALLALNKIGAENTALRAENDLLRALLQVDETEDERF